MIDTIESDIQYIHMLRPNATKIPKLIGKTYHEDKIPPGTDNTKLVQ